MTAIHDLTDVEVEHLLGGRYGPLVKLRVIGPGHVLLGELTPSNARSIAGHLLECAARAEYEADFYQAATRNEAPPEFIAVAMSFVREGEEQRQGGDSDFERKDPEDPET